MTKNGIFPVTKSSSVNPQNPHYDVLILGGGPAGISAAIWCVDLGLRPLIFEERAGLGGQMLWTHNPISNYPGIRAKNGAEAAELFTANIDPSKIDVIAGVAAESVDLAGRRVTLVDGRDLSGDSIIVATGIRRRRLNIPGEAEFVGRGILRSGAGERLSVAGKKVVIVGGGDAALENAVILGQHASEVLVVHRRSEFSARREFIEATRSLRNVRFLLDAHLEAIEGDKVLRTVAIRSGDQVSRIDTDALLIRIGVEPNTDIIRDQVKLDSRGYVVVDNELRTSVAGVWAVGDVTGPIAMTIANAVGQGSTAAKSIAAAR